MNKDTQLIWEAYIESESLGAVILSNVLRSKGFKTLDDQRSNDKDNTFEISFIWRHGDDKFIVVTVHGEGGRVAFIDLHIRNEDEEYDKQYLDLDSEKKFRDIAEDVLSAQVKIATRDGQNN